MPLIPDIALRVTGGPNAGLHLFDAKFRVQALTDVGLAAGNKGGHGRGMAAASDGVLRATLGRILAR